MKGKNKKTYRRKKLDIVKTLKAYENRIMSLPLLINPPYPSHL